MAGTTVCYAPFDQEGRFSYVNLYSSSNAQTFRFDAKNRVLSAYTQTGFIQSGAGTAGGRIAAYCAIDGTDKYSVVLLQSHLSTICQELIPLV
jgi:hypothetical protein